MTEVPDVSGEGPGRIVIDLDRSPSRRYSGQISGHRSRHGGVDVGGAVR